jgi:methyl-accepting chemotaxis protein
MDDETMFALFDSLKREMEAMRQEMRQETHELRQEMRFMRDSVERVETRLTRQGGLIQGGVRQVARLATWSEEVDEMLAERDARIEDLTRRVEKLEKNGG